MEFVEFVEWIESRDSLVESWMVDSRLVESRWSMVICHWEMGSGKRNEELDEVD